MRKTLLLPLLVAVVCGCGGPRRIDATSAKTYKASVDAMKESMGQVEKRQFDSDCMTVLSGSAPGMAVAPKKGAEAPKPADPEKAFMPLNGMSAEEIHTKAAEIRTSKTAKKK